MSSFGDLVLAFIFAVIVGFSAYDAAKHTEQKKRFKSLESSVDGLEKLLNELKSERGARIRTVKEERDAWIQFVKEERGAWIQLTREQGDAPSKERDAWVQESC